MTQDLDQTEGTVAVCLAPRKIKAWLQEIVYAFHQQDVERLAVDWTEDIVIRFADLPEIRGKQAAKAWLKARFARQKTRLIPCGGNLFQEFESRLPFIGGWCVADHGHGIIINYVQRQMMAARAEHVGSGVSRLETGPRN